jgi:hypothetical protein
MHADSAGGRAEDVQSRTVFTGAGSRATRSRIILIVLYLVFTLPLLPFLMANVPAFRILMPIHLALHALPLFITAVIDATFLDGGEVTPALIPLWSLLTGAMLWPLLVLSIWPAIWNSSGWRNAILAYGAVALLAMVAAGYWVFTHLGIFF